MKWGDFPRLVVTWVVWVVGPPKLCATHCLTHVCRRQLALALAVFVRTCFLLQVTCK